ncbi:glycosyltransferase [Treponema pedis]|uniref:glycosyltransferase n=1 Tax=Treponema pedis TaxID=409322 RepID=UPI003D1B7922
MITASIVLYNTDIMQLRDIINSYAPNSDRLLYLIDNSVKNIAIAELGVDVTYVRYIFNNKNVGYGAGHNIAIREAIKLNSTYHLVMNSDLLFDPHIIDTLESYMEKNDDIGQIMPKILDRQGAICHLCKLLPTPFDLFIKRFMPFKKIKEKVMYVFQLKFADYGKIMNIPYLSGCFMFFRMKALQEIGLFDERFFMYPEDIDITRRMHRKYKTIYYPDVSIVHFYGGGSYKSIKMLLIHLGNMIKYFNKWGWFFDKERKKINSSVLYDLNFKK